MPPGTCQIDSTETLDELSVRLCEAETAKAAEKTVGQLQHDWTFSEVRIGGNAVNLLKNRTSIGLSAVRVSASSAVQLGNHKGQKAAASCVGHFGLAQVVSMSFPQTFFSQATGSERIVVKVCSGRRDVLANPFSQGIGRIGPPS